MPMFEGVPSLTKEQQGGKVGQSSYSSGKYADREFRRLIGSRLEGFKEDSLQYLTDLQDRGVFDPERVKSLVDYAGGASVGTGFDAALAARIAQPAASAIGQQTRLTAQRAGRSVREGEGAFGAGSARLAAVTEAEVGRQGAGATGAAFSQGASQAAELGLRANIAEAQLDTQAMISNMNTQAGLVRQALASELAIAQQMTDVTTNYNMASISALQNMWSTLMGAHNAKEARRKDGWDKLSIATNAVSTALSLRGGGQGDR